MHLCFTSLSLSLSLNTITLISTLPGVSLSPILSEVVDEKTAVCQ